MISYIMCAWIASLLPPDLHLASYEGQIYTEFENMLIRYPNVPNYIWKRALNNTLCMNNKTRKGCNEKWATYVKMNYKKTKDYMGGDSIKRIDVLAQVGVLTAREKK